MSAGHWMSRLVMSSAAAVAMAVGAAAPVALGQTAKPNPQPLEPYVEPELDVNLWSQVYAYANRPRLLVLCGRGTDRHQAMDPGMVLSNLDATDVTQKIRSAFIGELNQPGADIEFVDDNAVRALMTRLKENVQQAGDYNAGELLKQQLGADQVILVRLGDSELQGSPFSVIVETTDLARGRRGASFPFDWKGGTDVVNIKANARAMAMKYVNDFALRVNNPVRYTVQVLGAATVQSQHDVLQGINSLSGLRGQARTRAASTVGGTGGDAVTEYEVAFLRGMDPDPTQLVADLSQVLGSRFNLAVEPRQAEAGRVAIRVSPGAPGKLVTRPATPAQPQTPGIPTSSTPQPGPSAPAPEPQAEQPPAKVEQPASGDLQSLYVQHGSPRVVVLINRAATREELTDWRQMNNQPGPSGPVTAENIIVIGGAAGGATVTPEKKDGGEFIDPTLLELWARQVEQSVSQSLAQRHGVTVQISPDLARASLLADIAAGQRYMGADQLLGLLKKEDVADIAVVGCGKIVSGIAGYEMVYTVETVELATSRRLGAALITAPFKGLSASDTLRRSSESFASRASSEVAGSLAAAWSSGAPVVLTISGLSSDEEARLVADAVTAHSRTLVLGGASAFRLEGSNGVATYTGTFAGPPDRAAAELERAISAAVLPFSVSVTSREASRISAEIRR